MYAWDIAPNGEYTVIKFLKSAFVWSGMIHSNRQVLYNHWRWWLRTPVQAANWTHTYLLYLMKCYWNDSPEIKDFTDTSTEGIRYETYGKEISRSFQKRKSRRKIECSGVTTGLSLQRVFLVLWACLPCRTLRSFRHYRE